jgi:Na+-translocating ferredoxin:NAD+ oxidoreductase subunit B
VRLCQVPSEGSTPILAGRLVFVYYRTKQRHSEAQMSESTYHSLAAFLDRLPGGYPPTASGVELRILRHLFAPEEAELALHLSLLPESAAVIARRANQPLAEVSDRLAEMARKGLINRHRKPGRVRYSAAQFVIGIWEHQVNRLDLDLIQDFNEYLPDLFQAEVWRDAPQLRTIPIGESVSAERGVLAYEDAETLVRQQTRLAVAPCICRREHRMSGSGCGRPEETCLIFGSAADYYIENGLAREIEVEEALGVLELARQHALVLQPSHAQQVVNICCCCGCCCQVLKGMKRHPRPAELAASAFRAVVDGQRCLGCGECLPRCQMEALSLQNGSVEINIERCLGCGLCISACPTEALSLERVPADQQPDIPVSIVDSYLHLARRRGVLKTHTLPAMLLRSKIDRLLAGD